MANTIPFDGCIPSEIIDLVFANHWTVLRASSREKLATALGISAGQPDF